MANTNNSILRVVTLILGIAALSGCVAADRSPTLNEARIGRGQHAAAGDTDLRAEETRAEVIEVLPARNEIRVRTSDGRDRIMTYNPNRTHVAYHGWDYTVDNLESGDIIAFRTAPQNSNYIDSIRVQEPVQARSGPIAPATRPSPPSSSARANIIDGTVERIQYDLGVFDVRVRPGELVTVSLPYNARPADVESFRRLRTGDRVRLEGEFVNRDNLQLYSFLSPR